MTRITYFLSYVESEWEKSQETEQEASRDMEEENEEG
jgi:hypothetical protein